MSEIACDDVRYYAFSYTPDELGGRPKYIKRCPNIKCDGGMLMLAQIRVCVDGTNPKFEFRKPSL